MFTGIIEQTSKVLRCQPTDSSFRIELTSPYESVQAGESIAVNGVCLTVLPSTPEVLAFDISPETLAITTLGQLKSGDFVNLERAMSASSRFGGHYVSGHVDCRAGVSSIQKIDSFIAMNLSGFEAKAKFFLIPKGSITVEGVSLTINAVSNDGIELMLIPHTLEKTTLGSLSVGQQVNIEYDYLARIIAHQLQCEGKLNIEEVS